MGRGRQVESLSSAINIDIPTIDNLNENSRNDLRRE